MTAVDRSPSLELIPPKALHSPEAGRIASCRIEDAVRDFGSLNVFVQKLGLKLRSQIVSRNETLL